MSASAFDQWAVQTSLMMKTGDEKPLYLNIHEAALIDYPAMHLLYNDSSRTFTSALTPDGNGHMAVIDTPFSTPMACGDGQRQGYRHTVDPDYI